MDRGQVVKELIEHVTRRDGDKMDLFKAFNVVSKSPEDRAEKIARFIEKKMLERGAVPVQPGSKLKKYPAQVLEFVVRKGKSVIGWCGQVVNGIFRISTVWKFKDAECKDHEEELPEVPESSDSDDDDEPPPSSGGAAAVAAEKAEEEARRTEGGPASSEDACALLFQPGGTGIFFVKLPFREGEKPTECGRLTSCVSFDEGGRRLQTAPQPGGFALSAGELTAIYKLREPLAFFCETMEVCPNAARAQVVLQLEPSLLEAVTGKSPSRPAELTAIAVNLSQGGKLPERCAVVTSQACAEQLALSRKLSWRVFAAIPLAPPAAFLRGHQDHRCAQRVPAPAYGFGDVLGVAGLRPQHAYCSDRIGGISLGGLLGFSPSTARIRLPPVASVQLLRMHPQLGTHISDSDLALLVDAAAWGEGYCSVSMTGEGVLSTYPHCYIGHGVGQDLVQADAVLGDLSFGAKKPNITGWKFLTELEKASAPVCCAPRSVDIRSAPGTLPFIAVPEMAIFAGCSGCTAHGGCQVSPGCQQFLQQCKVHWPELCEEFPVFRRIEALCAAMFVLRYMVHLGVSFESVADSLPPVMEDVQGPVP